MSVVLGLALLAATPSDEAIALGRTIAANGVMAVIAPLQMRKEAEDLAAAHPELSEAERAALRQTARSIADTASQRQQDAEGRAFAAALSIEDLRALAQFTQSDASQHMRAALPRIVGATMRDLGGFDYKGAVMAAFCKQTGKLC